jgi:peptidoglycan/LPS O-acetylase OafA/YrhL
MEPIGATKPAWTVSAFDGFAVLFAVLGGATFARVAFAPPRWMLNRFVLLLGRVSYSFYLWHLTVLILVFHLIHKTSVFVLLEEMHWVLRWVLLAGITGLLSICTAIVSYRLFEATYFSARKIQPPT